MIIYVPLEYDLEIDIFRNNLKVADPHLHAYIIVNATDKTLTH